MALLLSSKAILERWYANLSNSWLPAAAVILFVFALAANLLDDYPILPDGLRSIGTVGYFDAAPDVGVVFERLSNISRQHVPGYFVTLYAWANLAGWEPLALRLLSVYFGVLSLALTYRLARDLMTREAGLLAIVMLASLAFYNYWHLPIRMYTLMVAAELLVLVLYFRIVRRCRTRRAYAAALCLALILFLSTHIFSLAVCAGLSIYHLLFVPKNRNWLVVAAAGIIAAAVLIPWIGNLMTGAVEISEGEFGEIAALSATDLVVTVIELGINKSVLFLALLALSLKQAWARDGVSIALWVITAVAVIFYLLANEASDAIDLHRARYLVILFPLIILLMVRGALSLTRWKLLPLGILGFWIASGLLFQRRVGADFFVRSYGTIPIHLVERQLRDDLRAGDLIAGWTNGLNFDYRTPYGSVTDYYFAGHAVDVVFEHNYQLGKLSDEAIVRRARSGVRPT